MSFAANPRAPKIDPSQIPQEPTGPIAADSLAAESIKQDGGFAENDNAVPLSVKGGSSTLNTTDTSGATALRPAESGAARETQDALGAGADERGTTGLKLDSLEDPRFSGRHTTQGYSGGPGQTSTGTSTSGGAGPAGASDFGAATISSSESSNATSDLRSTGGPTSHAGTDSSTGTSGSSGSAGASTSSGGTGGGPSAGAGVRPHVPTAPNYTGAVTGDILSSGTFKPKGMNLEDADLTDSIPKTKTFTGNVGGANDPGRLAERGFEGVNTEPTQEASQSGVEGGRQRGGEQEVGGKFGVLESERA